MFVVTRHVLERSCSGVIVHFPQVAVVIVQSLFLHNDIPAMCHGGQHPARATRVTQFELNREWVQYVDLGHGAKVSLSAADKIVLREDDALIRGFNILCTKVGPIVELHPIPKEECISF